MKTQAASQQDIWDSWHALWRATPAPAWYGPGLAGWWRELATQQLQQMSASWTAIERATWQLLDSPSLGYGRELNEKVRRSVDAWLELSRAGRAYQGVLAEAWLRVVDDVLCEMARRAADGESAPSARHLLSVATLEADRAFAEVFRSEEYIAAQRQLVNGALSYKVRAAEITDAVLTANHLPTRQDLDEAHRDIYQLRKEVKALRQALRGRATEDGEDLPTAQPATSARSEDER